MHVPSGSYVPQEEGSFQQFYSTLFSWGTLMKLTTHIKPSTIHLFCMPGFTKHDIILGVRASYVIWVMLLFAVSFFVTVMSQNTSAYSFMPLLSPHPLFLIHANVPECCTQEKKWPRPGWADFTTFATIFWHSGFVWRFLRANALYIRIFPDNWQYEWIDSEGWNVLENLPSHLVQQDYCSCVSCIKGECEAKGVAGGKCRILVAVLLTRAKSGNCNLILQSGKTNTTKAAQLG